MVSLLPNELCLKNQVLYSDRIELGACKFIIIINLLNLKLFFYVTISAEIFSCGFKANGAHLTKKKSTKTMHDCYTQVE